MSADSRREMGFPTNTIKGSDYSYYAGCGGSGAVGCVLPATFSYLYWPIKVNPFSVKNTKLVLHNDYFSPYADSAVGTCAHNQGARLGFNLLLFYKEPTGVLDYSKATGNVAISNSLSFPYEIELDMDYLPQPDNSNYERKIWVVCDFGQIGVMIGGLPQISEVMQTIKLNWEGNP